MDTIADAEFDRDFFLGKVPNAMHAPRLIGAAFVALSAWTSMPHDAVGQTTAGTPPQPPADRCATGRFRDFDFWVGQWEVRDATGKVAGQNTITREEKGCAIVERWKGANGGTGQSLNHYDPDARRWRQHWVGLGLVLEMEGEFKDGAMTLEGPLQYVGQQRTTRLRGIWTVLPDGRVRQEFVESDDGGKTWQPWFDGYYSRKSAGDREGSD